MFRQIMLLALISMLAVTATAAKRPNVVMIMTDDQSWDSIAFAGGKVYTPRLDQMRENGIYFSDFNVTSTVCSPSRYSFMTGRYAGRGQGEMFMKEHPLGDQTQVENIGEIEPDLLNLPKVLQKGGYKTGFVGKSHLINHEWVCEMGDNEEGWKKAGFELYAYDADPRDPEVTGKMQRNHAKWCEAMKPYGFDFVDGYYAANLRELFNGASRTHNLEWSVSKAFKFLEKYKEDPFFLYFSTTLHHGPAPWNNKNSLDADIRMTGEGFVAEGFDVMPSRKEIKAKNRKAGFKDKAAYAYWLDCGVGAILDKLKELELEENTIVFFVSDHGSYRHGKATLYENGMRVPMIAKWPGKIKPNSTYDGIAANIDFAPTILDLCGVAKPADYYVDGLSFKPALFGSAKPMREYLLGELGHSRAIKSKDWKYIAIRYPDEIQKQIDEGEKFKNFKNNPPLDRPYLTRNSHLGYYASAKNPNYFQVDQLYNLNNDVAENNNIFSQNPEVAEKMKKALSKALKGFEQRPFAEFTD